MYIYSKKITEPQPKVSLYKKATSHMKMFKHKQATVNKAFPAQRGRACFVGLQVQELEPWVQVLTQLYPGLWESWSHAAPAPLESVSSPLPPFSLPCSLSLLLPLLPLSLAPAPSTSVLSLPPFVYVRSIQSCGEFLWAFIGSKQDICREQDFRCS